MYEEQETKLSKHIHLPRAWNLYHSSSLPTSEGCIKQTKTLHPLPQHLTGHTIKLSKRERRGGGGSSSSDIQQELFSPVGGNTSCEIVFFSIGLK